MELVDVDVQKPLTVVEPAPRLTRSGNFNGSNVAAIRRRSSWSCRADRAWLPAWPGSATLSRCRRVMARCGRSAPRPPAAASWPRRWRIFRAIGSIGCADRRAHGRAKNLRWWLQQTSDRGAETAGRLEAALADRARDQQRLEQLVAVDVALDHPGGLELETFDAGLGDACGGFAMDRIASQTPCTSGSRTGSGDLRPR